MPVAHVNGINLGYDDHGSGEPVVMITGTAAPGRIWRAHQVPALKAAGYRVVTVDNRGIPPTDLCEEGFTLDDMAADVAALITHLDAGPCRVVGFSLGGIIVQELLLARPDLVSQAVLIASCGRADALITAMSAADLALADSGITLPARYAAYVQALQNLSPDTLNDEEQLQDWLSVLELSPPSPAAVRGQLGLQLIGDRLPAYRRITVPCQVIGFRDDLIARPALVRELARHIPGAAYAEIPGCGHYGCLEKPDTVNEIITAFFTRN
ncbi:alpha/beta fold hydrolase [Streptomyces daghestanicus]|uniref:Hydrolase n=1 Tax=Streptomyces daghestanicus TaxID=66885 RepID=A0ABQ3Q867_9ACTN|nr:alpha/beta hydrolase [Streptomyces daghestanicus]GGU69972.1 hydrolase [Streptomyces daghestanicus]GHI33472.1 hydrolase [Streptomyces daghestanicus]